MMLVAGVDSSTQSCKVVVCEAESGKIVRQRRIAHPEGTEVPARAWWDAWLSAADGLLDGVAAIAVAAQQHGLVTLDARGRPVRDALLWNDTRSAGAAAALVEELGGPQEWAKAVGSVPLAAHTVAKLRWMADREPELADRVARVLLPHDYLTWRLRGGTVDVEPTTDRGDASGTGYWSPGEERYREDLLALAFRGRRPGLPRVLGPAQTAGHTPDGVLVAAGTGDNAAAALGLGLREGEVVVSLGTSGTVYTRSSSPSADATGAINGFADATGAYLPLVCTLNAARVLEAAARMLGVAASALEGLARQAVAGADGLTLLPYLTGERTPDLPEATGTLHGLTPRNMRPPNIARAAAEGMVCNLAEALDRLRAGELPPRRVVLIGGAAASPLIAEIARDIFGLAVAVPEPREYVALGAARQAAWALTATANPPDWPVPPAREIEAPAVDSGRAIRERYGRLRRAIHGN
ncbi:xylulokinase [Nocardia sp. CDC159]|uniref:Xylulose kinase n=1 Tax=Nocardia pulmonis TaxID=2951408 RepID=A0A9X2E8L9_9NOCA|nr:MULTISPECIES: xylulokinase [Nocardia]MCM6773731.1 xylulokinase [Nocardia pulmonis]MCM6786618.1 xylulokinase [Nocardia sp. CDC159]